MKWWTFILGLFIVPLRLASATACPFCETETATQVHAGIFNDEFWSNAMLTLLPLIILLGVVAVIYWDVSWLWNRDGAAENSVPDRQEAASHV